MVLVEVGEVHMAFGPFITLNQDVKKTPERLYNTSFAIYPQKIPLGQLSETMAEVGGSRFISPVTWEAK